MKRSILFIVNPISGTRDKGAVQKDIETLTDASQFDYRIAFTEYAGHASVLAREAVENGFDIVVAVGGDGTVNEVARSLVHTPTALGIIPCGSGNGLARHLQIPLDARKAMQIINRATISSLDYGTINAMPFFCTCGVGFDAFVSLKFATGKKRGLLSYIENTLREGLSYKPETYTIEDEEGTVKYDAFLIACANASQYGNNAYIAPNASMEDGLMDVTVMEPFSAIEAPQLAIQLFNRTIDHNSHIKTFRSKKYASHAKATVRCTATATLSSPETLSKWKSSTRASMWLSIPTRTLTAKACCKSSPTTSTSFRRASKTCSAATVLTSRN